jgi:hypothetical protein
MVHIQECLPDLRAKIGSTIAETQTELESYGNPLLNSSSSLVLTPLLVAISFLPFMSVCCIK